MANEKVSVIVPIYNVEAYLPQCVDSILNQTYDNLEIILVDDGSPDNCGAICDEYAAKDCRIRVIHQENGGLSAARNAGLDIADGEYIAFVDSDDWVAANFIEQMILYAAPESIAMCNYIQFESEYSSKPALHNATAECIGTIEFWNRTSGSECVPCTVVWNKLYHRRIFDNVRFFKGIIHEDEEILHRIIDRVSQIVLIPEPLYFYRRTATSTMGRGFNPNRLDLFVGLAERLQYFHQKNLIQQEDSLSIRYWKNYKNWLPAVEKSSETERVRTRAIRSYRMAFPSLMRANTISPSQKISVVAMRISPECFERMWHFINKIRGIKSH